MADIINEGDSKIEVIDSGAAAAAPTGSRRW